jgi:ureidoacrylate peracid hydrolase
MRKIGETLIYDTLAELIDPAHTALLVIDAQNDFCHPDGHFARHGKDLSMIEERLPKVSAFVREAQSLGVRTVFTLQATLPDGKSDSPAWLRFKCRDGKSPDYTLQGTWGWQLVDGLEAGRQDLIVEKFRPDSFIQTNLDQLLRANGIETVVILGFITEGCVESTVRAASYRDYYTVVVRDGIASPNLVLHEGSLRLYEARYPLHNMAEILEVWRKSAQTRSGQTAVG